MPLLAWAGSFRPGLRWLRRARIGSSVAIDGIGKMANLKHASRFAPPSLPVSTANPWRGLRVRFDSIVWRSIWFRSAAYYCFLVFGKSLRIVSTGFTWFWPGFVLFFGVTTLYTLSLHCSGQCTLHTVSTIITIRFAVWIFVVYSILWTSVFAYFSRRKIVVLETVNRAGEEFNVLARGLSAEIMAALSELRQLHSARDARRPNGEAVAPPIIRFDQSGSLSWAEVVGEKSSMKIFGFELPIGPPGQTLLNAKNAGYLDLSGKGQYRLNPVGHNLVTHKLSRGEGSAPSGGPRRARKTAKKLAKVPKVET